jgi:NADPH:quinone reductase
MKAGWYERNGPAREVLTVGELPTPQPAPGEVRVRIAASGVNPSDVKSRRGRPMIAPLIVPHSDGAGVIDAVGEGVDKARVGERVWTWNGQWKRPMGTAAEFIALPSAQAVKLPDDVDFADAACFGIPLLTAIEAVSRAGPVDGRTVLVTGAASAVGHYATQILRSRGARVIGTASDRRAHHARAAGAAEVVDYRAEDAAERIRALTDGRGADAVIDMDLSSTVGLVSKGALASHGTFVCYGSNAPEVPLTFMDFLFRCITLKFFVVYELTAEERRAALAELDALLEGGTLSHTIGARFPLERIADAHEAVEGGQVIGNVVLDIG